jgi:hypothetical protein
VAALVAAGFLAMVPGGMMQERAVDMTLEDVLFYF